MTKKSPKHVDGGIYLITNDGGYAFAQTEPQAVALESVGFRRVPVKDYIRTRQDSKARDNAAAADGDV